MTFEILVEQSIDDDGKQSKDERTGIHVREAETSRDTRGYRVQRNTFPDKWKVAHLRILLSFLLKEGKPIIVGTEITRIRKKENIKINLPFGVVNFNGELPVAKVQVFQLFPLKYLVVGEKKEEKKNMYHFDDG